MPFGQRRQICCEQIEISASDSSLPDLRAVVLPLAVPDLPVIRWCRGARLFGLADFPHLAGIACKLVLDSAAFSDPASILGQLHERSHSGQVFGDLAWTRLTHWRELVSQIFESRGCLARLPDIGQVRLVYGGAAPPSGAYYLAAWLLDSLESGGAHAQVNWESAAGAPPGRLARIDLGGAEGNEPRVSIELTGGPDRQSAIVRVGSLSNHAVFPPDNDYVLLREELGIPGRDPVFERSLERAARLAQVEKK
jgi:hypothetical protein